jgi:hypothetical protein
MKKHALLFWLCVKEAFPNGSKTQIEPYLLPHLEPFLRTKCTSFNQAMYSSMLLTILVTDGIESNGMVGRCLR